MVNQVTTLAEFLQEEMRQRDWSVRQFAEAAGLVHSTIVKLMRFEDAPTPSLETLAAISKATNTSLITLIGLAYPDLQSVAVDPNTLLLAERIEKLPPDQRALLDSLIIGMLFKHQQK